MKTTIDMARQVGYPIQHEEWRKATEEFAALVAQEATEEANRRANASWTLMCEKMVAAEREACAQLCEDQWQTAHDIQDAIRARGNT